MVTIHVIIIFTTFCTFESLSRDMALSNIESITTKYIVAMSFTVVFISFVNEWIILLIKFSFFTLFPSINDSYISFGEISSSSFSK